MTPLEQIIFIDIETVSQYKNWKDIPVPIQNIWSKKHERSDYLNSLPIETAYKEKAAIFAEYGKIVCISVGLFDSKKEQFRLKSFYSENEASLLSNFVDFCLSLKKKFIFCGHNIKEFDIPYICRRLLVSGYKIPKILDFQDKKPWEIELIDTMQYWRFGDYKNYTSLETLTTIFQLPTPKEDIDGSQVGRVFWEENNLVRIAEYCQQDVVAVMQLYRKFHHLPLLSPSQIEIILHS